MAIAEDVSSPAAMNSNTGQLIGSQITASFTPPAGSLLIAMCSNQWNASYAGLPGSTITYTDSLSGTWTPINNKNAGTGGAAMCSTAYRIIGSSAAMTVTATFVDTLSKQSMFDVRVLTGAATSGTIATSLAAVFATTANFTQQTVTTTTVGSKPMIVISDDNANALTVNANTTQYSNAQDTVVSSTSASGRATNLTVTPGSLSLGWTGSAATFQQCVCVIEVMPASAGSTTPIGRQLTVGQGAVVNRSFYW